MRTQSQSEGSALPPSYFQGRPSRQLSQTHSEPEGYGATAGSGVLLAHAVSGTMGTAGSASRVSASLAGSSREGLEPGGPPGVTWGENRDATPRCMVLPTARATLRAMHTEYTR